ncbi:MAG TPA: type II secretion system protein [Myxococcota bacterium]|nr:type II secretion system protein [Myxococcota bacterium]
MRTAKHSPAGFTLIEMMVVVAIMGVVTAQLFTVFNNQKKVYASADRALDVQETARLTLDLISFDTRMAGFMVPDYLAVSSVDGGKDHADRLCVSASPFSGKDAFLDPTLTKGNHFAGAAVSSVDGGGKVVLKSLDVDNDGQPDIGQGGAIIVASHTHTYCARIANLDLGTLTVTFDVPGGENPHDYLGDGDADMAAVPANIYELNEGTSELRRNTMLLGSQIEDFQVEYWLDNSGVPNGVEDGDAEFPVNNLNQPDPPGGAEVADNSQIRRVRVSVTSVTTRGDQSNSATGHTGYGRPALANRVAGAPDLLRRRSFSASILPRNILEESGT